MINVDIRSILNDLTSEGANPAASDDSTAPFASKADGGSRRINQSLGSTITTVPIGIIPAAAKGRSVILARSSFSAFFETTQGNPLRQSSTRLQAGLEVFKRPVVLGSVVPTALR